MALNTEMDEYSYDSDGNKVKTTYSLNADTMDFTLLDDSIKADFNFITSGGSHGSLIDKLETLKGKLKTACSVSNAFYFDNGSGQVDDLMVAYEEIAADIEAAIAELPTLKSAIDTDIDNINAELKNNYGWPVRFKKGSITKTETMSSGTTS